MNDYSIPCAIAVIGASMGLVFLAISCVMEFDRDATAVLRTDSIKITCTKGKDSLICTDEIYTISDKEHIKSKPYSISSQEPEYTYIIEKFAP